MCCKVWCADEWWVAPAMARKTVRDGVWQEAGCINCAELRRIQRRQLWRLQCGSCVQKQIGVRGRGGAARAGGRALQGKREGAAVRGSSTGMLICQETQLHQLRQVLGRRCTASQCKGVGSGMPGHAGMATGSHAGGGSLTAGQLEGAGWVPRQCRCAAGTTAAMEACAERRIRWWWDTARAARAARQCWCAPARAHS